jgi:hypothetical protein
LLKRLGVQEYHETLLEVRRRGSPEVLTSLPRAASELAPEVCQTPPNLPKLDLQPTLSTIVDIPQDASACPECAHERLGCVTCTQATRNSSVDTSRIPRRAKSDSEFRHPQPLPPLAPLAPLPLANDEYWKVPWRPVLAKKSGKLQKKIARY